ncbi:MAG TPA: glycerol-3-phosphate 1-O-acyltransferase PlsY [Vicinamibacteria bacterium]|nr:glycerol-3-phosphate 1-O-acyltransferase PlsY [Vicinamibacteria bacterium]
MARAALLLALAYLTGSIPFSFLVARLFGVRDVRAVGSGNVGATNVLRSAGRTAGLLAFLLDASKGAVAAFVVQRLEGPLSPMAPLAAAAAVLGHMYPVWLGFRGGKGVATGAGAFLPLAPVATAVGLLVFGLTLAVSRYVSLASMAGALALAAATFVSHRPPATCWTALSIAFFVVWKHRANLQRLSTGTETRIGSGRG